MRNRMQWLCVSLCLASAFPAAAQFTSFGGTPGSPATSLGEGTPGSPATSAPPGVSGGGTARRVDPIVFLDQFVDEGGVESLLHLSAYADGWVSVSAAELRGSAVADAEADWVDVGAEAVRILQQELIAAGALRLSGSLPEPSGTVSRSDSFTQVTVFRQRASRRQKTFSASSFRFGPDVQDPRALRVAATLETFVLRYFPDLDLP